MCDAMEWILHKTKPVVCYDKVVVGTQPGSHGRMPANIIAAVGKSRSVAKNMKAKTEDKILTTFSCPHFKRSPCH